MKRREFLGALGGLTAATLWPSMTAVAQQPLRFADMHAHLWIKQGESMRAFMERGGMLLVADIPTTAEAGFPSVQATGWNGVMVPAATPKEIVAKINAELGTIMAAPEMKARLVEQGFLPVTMSVADTEKFVAADVERWGKMIREGGIKSE